SARLPLCGAQFVEGLAQEILVVGMRVDGASHESFSVCRFALGECIPCFYHTQQTLPDLLSFAGLADRLPVPDFQRWGWCCRVVGVHIGEQAVVAFFGGVMVLVELVYHRAHADG